MPAILYIVATPIGNLQDVTLRALEILKRVSVVYAEDTRVTRKLFERFEIATPIKSYHQHSGSRGVREVIEALRHGDAALVTDAGTPGVADPGNELIEEVMKALRHEGIKIIPVPGASAVTAAASISGFNMSRFCFLGYVPKKKGRKRFFEEVAKSDMPVILYETPHRIIKTLEELHAAFTSSREESFNRVQGKLGGTEGSLHSLRSVGMTVRGDGRRVVVCRELTKLFESIYRGTIEEVLEQVRKDPVKGEYVVVVDKSS